MAETKEEPKTETVITEPSGPAQPANPQKSQSSILKIILIVLGVLLLLCTICGIGGLLVLRNSKSKVIQRLNEVYPNSSSSSSSVTPTSDFLYGSNAKLPSDFPSDVPVYPDAKLNVINTNGEDKDAKFVVSYTASVTADKVVDFYKKELVAKGWTIDNETNIFGTVLDAKKSDRTINMFILGDEGDKTNFTITVSK